MGSVGRMPFTNMGLERDAWKHRAQSAEAALKRRNKEGIDLLQELNDVRAQRRTFENALKTRGQEYDAAVKRAEGWKKDYDTAVAGARGYQLQANQLEGVHAAAIAKTVRLAAEVEALQMTALEKDKKISELQAIRPSVVMSMIDNCCCGIRKAQNERLKKQIDSLEVQYAQERDNASLARSDLANKAHESNVLRDKVEALEAKLKDREGLVTIRNKECDRLMRERDDYRNAQDRTAKKLKRVEGQRDDLQKKWSQTLDSRATLWRAIDRARGKKKGKMLEILHDAQDEAYITEWKGDSKVVILSEVADDMFGALCHRCKAGEALNRKGQTWGHVATNLFGGQSFVRCEAHELREFMRERYARG